MNYKTMKKKVVSETIEDKLNRPLVIVYRVDELGCTKCADCALLYICSECSLPSGYIFVDYVC